MSGAAVPEPIHLRFDEFELEEANARLRRGGDPIALAPTPFALLCALARRPGTLQTKHALLDAVWGHRFVSDSVLKGAISDIRTVLGDDPRSPRYIETVARRGYRFLAQPSAAGTPASAPAGALAYTSEAGLRVPDVERAAPGFVGRAMELSTLAAAWERACNGQRVIAWVAGEPGIGKTTLIEQFIARLGAVDCARGQCVQGFGAGEPYHALLDALATLARRDASVAPMLRDIAPTWLLQLPWLSSVEQRESLMRELAGVNPERMLREMGEFLDRYTEQRPLLLVTEDLHWADRATIQLIDYIARRRGPARLLWLSSFRLAEVVVFDHPLDTLRHDLRVHQLCVEIVLDSFTELEIAAYLAGHAPALAHDDALVRALLDRTDGVPLFLASVADDVAARLAAGGDAAAALASIPIPQNLSALIDHYLARLDADRRALLAAAAICGSLFRIETLARVLGREVLEVHRLCDALACEHYWLVALPGEDGESDSPGGHFAFRHQLYRQVLLDRASKPARIEMHRRVAAALEQERAAGTPVAAAELAAHFEQGRLPLPAARYFAEAALTAIRQLHPAECIALGERALALLAPLPATREQTELAITLVTLTGVASFHARGAGDHARAAFARAFSRLADAPEHPSRGLLLHGFGFLLCLRGEYDEALLIAARAEALGDSSDDALLVVAASTVQGQVHNMQGRPAAARRALERVLPAIASLTEAAETRLLGFIADPQVTARGLLALPLLHLGLLRQGRAHLDAALARARGLGQPMSVMVALWCEALFEIRLGDADRVAAIAAEMQSLADEFALAQGRSACLWFQGWAQTRHEQPGDGYQQIRDALEQNLALGMQSGATETMGYAAEALVAAGDLLAAQALLNAALALVERLDERIYLPQLRLIEARIARAQDRSGRAQDSVREAIVEARAQGARWLELLALIELVEHNTPTSEDLSGLAALADQLEEAQDTSAIATARRLLNRHRLVNS